jgi:UDP-N-acetylglucosamine 2-epimerase (non-hydrolysing)
MKKKIMTIIGTRPEIIRLCIIIEKMDKYYNHVLVHTGQNYDYNLNELFFKQLKVRKPDYFLGIKEKSFGTQIGKILSESEKVILKENPEALIILGDTNSGLSSIIAKKLGIPVYHLEAGNRCYDDRVPEDVNRRFIDHSSSVLMPYTNRSKENLLREGIERERIFVIGNPIFEVINHFKEKISKSKILDKLNLKKREFFLVTMHRAENVDIKERLQNIVNSLQLISKKYRFPIICSLHPRTKDKMLQYGISKENYGIEFLEPLGFFDFIKLEILLQGTIPTI